MHNIFWSSFFRNGRTRRPVSIMLFLGLFVAVLCTSITLGYAHGQYIFTAGYSDYATLSAVPGEDVLADLDGFADFLNKQYSDTLSNVLYLTQAEENQTLIGWQGIEGNRWFPYTGGRFFTEQEQLDGENVVFITRSYYTHSEIIESMEISGEAYRVIGSGWIAPFNLEIGISDESHFVLFPDNTDDKPYIQIIPYKRYISNHVPALILVHFDFASVKDLKNYALEIGDLYPDTKIYFPNKNSDDVLAAEQRIGMIGSLIICAIASLTLIQLAHQWSSLYKKELYVYHICGMTRLKCMLLLLGHWSVYFVAASAAAIAVHLLSFPLLQILEANYTPRIGPLLLILSFLYGITAIFSFRGIRNSLSTGEKGDIL